MMASKVCASILLASPLLSPCLGFLAPLPSIRSVSQHARSGRNHVRCSGTLREVVASARMLRRRNDAQPRRMLCRTSGQALGATVVEDGTIDDPTLVEPLKQWAEENFPGCSTRQSPAKRLSAVLADLWETLADTSAVTEDKPRVMYFPDCPEVSDARGLQSLYEHLEVCQDTCEHFGAAVSVVPHPKGGAMGAPAPALVVKAIAGAGGGEDFGYDADWDDDWDIDRSLLGDDEGDAAALGGEDGMQGSQEDGEVDVAALSIVPESDADVTELTEAWVQSVITDMGVCPFSVDASRAGLPVGKVRYALTRESTVEAIYREYWKEVDLLVSQDDERELSTTLLIAPAFALNNAEAFELMGHTLTQPLEGLGLEEDIQLVFFHPQYAFRDGSDRLGSAGAANFARRSPFPMINILRTKQVRLAQRSIPTGLVYKQNEEVLQRIGAGPLQRMLESRDWTGLQGNKVDRRQAEYYEIARKLQGLGGKASSEAGVADEVQLPLSAGVDKSAPGVDGVTDESGADADAVADPDGVGVPDGINPGMMPVTPISSESMTSEMGDSGFAPVEMIQEERIQPAMDPAVAQSHGGSPTDSADDEALVDPATLGPAASSERISEEDLRTVASALVKRLGTGKPLRPEVFEAFSEAVDGILRDTTAST